ncbi:uncharacterized protein BX663DRAFT_471752 [Cokeromyces recurvatus]|uniref:uncharacterized protein n=1 Tax=Cokeromyces recurvatus TaxID=90255 RepID=UPI00221F632C|nr:uncharacterized protein BX663DRAFT_471752 [Cokeromyces recurvatus]KAI7903726.1 hypothetical protein BX663DRAFT_471752 [Cokeromyces recurvatus]
MVRSTTFLTIISSSFLIYTSALPINKPSPTILTTIHNGLITTKTRGVLANASPNYLPSFPYHGFKPLHPIPTGPIDISNRSSIIKRENYPEPWVQPDVNHPEVQAAINSIAWNHVPNFTPRTANMEYDVGHDEACWWTKSGCTTPKVQELPMDTKYCKKIGDFGLTYDDGPLLPQSPEDVWGEPRLYDFLAKYNQTATLFYVGSNVVNFPEAAVRALQSGHTLCVHTWSHPLMTSLTSHEIVAQLYWTLRVIKEATGVTTRCWRPPYGDVDDRVRAIAHQMGLSTILWDSDSFDWGLPSSANGFSGTYTEEMIDGFFQQWIDDRKAGVDQQGRIVLEHEASNMTVAIAEKWLPELKSTFNVKRVHDCAPELPNPYWELPI